MPSYLPAEFGAEDLILTAMHDLLTEKCQTELETGDVTRATLVKVGPAQAAPDGVSILIHENDPDDPQSWAHRPMKYPGQRSSGGLQDPYSQVGMRTTPGLHLMGGGNLYGRSFLLEVEVFGIYLPSGIDIGREEVRRVASVVTRRALRALLEAGRKIGTGRAVTGDFGETVMDGPFLDRSWTSPEEGESLIIRKFIRFWYKTSMDWSTDDW